MSYACRLADGRPAAERCRVTDAAGDVDECECQSSAKPRPLTGAERQQRYLARHRAMRDALEAVLQARTLAEAKAIAAVALAT